MTRTSASEVENGISKKHDSLKGASIEDLTENEMAMIRDARVEIDHPFTLDDLPEIDTVRRT